MSTTKPKEVSMSTEIEKLEKSLQTALENKDLAKILKINSELETLKAAQVSIDEWKKANKDTLDVLEADLKKVDSDDAFRDALQKALAKFPEPKAKPATKKGAPKKASEKKDTRPTAKTKDVPAILAHISKNPNCKSKDIADSLGLQALSISLMLGKLKKDGKIKGEGPNKVNQTYTVA